MTDRSPFYPDRRSYRKETLAFISLKNRLFKLSGAIPVPHKHHFNHTADHTEVMWPPSTSCFLHQVKAHIFSGPGRASVGHHMSLEPKGTRLEAAIWQVFRVAFITACTFADGLFQQRPADDMRSRVFKYLLTALPGVAQLAAPQTSCTSSSRRCLHSPAP